MSDDKPAALVSIEDFFGLSGPLTKLIDVVAAGMGNAYRPVGIVREAKAGSERIRALASAHGDAIRTIAAAEADAHREMDKLNRERELARLEHVPDIARRAELRAAAEAISQQENLERIAGKASKYMSDETNDKPVDADWRTLFFRNARDVSDDTMRDVWGQVLAGEVTKPGTYGVRTLDVLRLMSKAEAEAFAKLCSLVFEPDYIVKIGSGLDKYGVAFNDVLALQGAGVLFESPEISKKFPKPGYGVSGRCLVVTHDLGLQLSFNRPAELPVYMLTRAGRELRRLVDSNANAAYVADAENAFAVAGLEVARIPIRREGEQIRVGSQLYHPDTL